MLETTIVIIVISGIAFLVFCVRACFMSKCKKVKLGCIEIEREISREQNVSQLKFEIPK